MGLSKPNFSFAIPSSHDDNILDCRLYHPKESDHSRSVSIAQAAIIAHPYAPLGGCYDDPVVNAVGVVLLKAGYVVGTFNFRGAGGSAGRTSWTAKPELADYVSFYGFMLSYMSSLGPSGPGLPLSLEENALSPIQSAASDLEPGPSKTSSSMRLVLAGYSYGSMIASHLPSADVVRDIFRSPESGSAEAEIRLRATHMARLRMKNVRESQQRRQSSHDRENLRADDPLHASSHAISVGGFESESTSRRISRDSFRKSIDGGVRKSLDHVREKLVARKPSSGQAAVSEEMPDVDLVVPEVCYLLISPLLPPVGSFTTMFTNLSFHTKKKTSSSPSHEAKPNSELTLHPACAVYGDKDTFTSQRKLRSWAEHLKQRPASRFSFYEIDGAGHFWHDRSSADRLKGSIRDWLLSLDAQ